MRDKPIHQALADAFVAEGVDTFFALMGDANMHFLTALKNAPGVTAIMVRHEHCTCTMATGYHGATGKIGVASVTCGPGYTQIITALTTAARNHIPLVVLAGEPPLSAAWYGQTIDQAALTKPTGARYFAAHSTERIHQYVCEAFHHARTHRLPAVIGVPYDLQNQPLPEQGPYRPSTDIVPDIGRPLPDLAQIAVIAERLLTAQCPVIVAGRGVLQSGSEDLARALADRTGSLLATTLPARGLFDDHPFSLGISGGYSRAVAREMAAQADFVLMLGASLSFYTVDGGRLYPKAEIAQVDLEPSGYSHGLKAGDIHLRGDVGATLAALFEEIGVRRKIATVRTDELAERLRGPQEDATPFEIASGELDPRVVVAEIDRVVPKDYFTVEGAGHSSYFPTAMRGRNPRRHLAVKEFSAIGNALTFTCGVAAAERDGRVLVIDGDGGFLMHIQELETVRRHRLKALFVVLNDGAYGAEIHKLRSQGIDDSGADFGRADLGSIAIGFGLAGATITDISQIEELYREYEAGDKAAVWDVHVSQTVTSPRMRAGVKRGHGRP